MGASMVPSSCGRSPREQRDVQAVDVAPLHGGDQRLVGVVAARHDEQAGRVLVEPVDDAGARLVPAARPLGHQSLGQGAVLVARRRVHDHAGGLVHHEQPVVLVDDGVRDGLGLQQGDGLRRRLPGDALAGAHQVLLARRLAVDQHEAFGDELLRRGPAQAGAGGEHHVEPPALGVLPRHERPWSHSRGAKTTWIPRKIVPTTMAASATLKDGQL